MHFLPWKKALTRTLIVGTLVVGMAGCDDDDTSDGDDNGGGNNGDVNAGNGNGDTNGNNNGNNNGSNNNGDNNGGNDAGNEPMGDTYGITSAGRLVIFERATGEIERAVALSGLTAGETVVASDTRPADGTLFVLSNMGKLYVVNLVTGACTLKSTLAADPADATEPYTTLTGTKLAMDFNPVVDRLRIVSNDGQNLRVNVDTGATFTDTALVPATPGATAAAYSNSFAAACRTRLYVIDSTSKNYLLQDPPNDGNLTVLGPLGSTVFDEVTAFEIVTANDGANEGTVALASTTGAQLADINVATGAVSNARAIDLEAGETLTGLAALPPTTTPAQVAGELLGLTVDNRVVSFNRGAPGKLCTSAAITGLAASEQAVGMDVRPADGALYVLGSTGKLYTVAVATGVATLRSTLAADTGDTFTALSGADFAVGFNPVVDRLRVLSNSGQNLRINVDTGATITDSALNQGTPTVTATAYTNSFAGAKTTTLFALDTGTDSLVWVGGDPATGGACPGSIGNPNCGRITPVGTLNTTGDVSAVNGFDIDGKTGAALAALVLGTATTSTLFSIDLESGVATAVPNGTIGGGQPLRGLTFAANLVVTAYALTADNHLLVFAPATPSAPTADLTITGLQGGERLLGIDVRPRDGKLYALGLTARLYTLNTMTGAATEVVMLKAPAADTSAPFTALPAVDHGFDFNPQADALRVVNADADNLRIIPSARAALLLGDTFTDTDLSGGTPDVRAAAYTNSFVNAPSTVLYVIDSTADSLYIQNPPNDGTLSLVGALGVSVTGDVGFDVVGGHNGLSLAAIRTAGLQSELYTIALGTGAAAPLNNAANTIGAATATQVVGLALDLK